MTIPLTATCTIIVASLLCAVAPRAWAQVRVDDVYLYVGAHGFPTAGVLISDPATKRLRFERTRGPAVEIPYASITAVHSEPSPRRSRHERPTQFLTVVYTDNAGVTGYQLISIPLMRLDTTILGLERDLGRKIDVTGPNESFLGLPNRVLVGAPVEVTDNTAIKIVGRLTAISPSSIVVSGFGAIPDSSVQRVRLRDSNVDGAIAGGLAAMLAPLHMLVMCHDGCAHPAKIYWSSVGVGVAIGATIDALKKPTVYVSGGSAVRVELLPFLHRGGSGLRGAITFGR